ncbi:MAG TPA: DUF6351 family protein [Thermoleophilaceae bacterium]|nr:DUF6351 family protein [Thermoleophilaceae bacterium]
MRGRLVLAAALATFALGAGTAQAAVSIDVLSNRADLISGGDALVAVDGGTPASMSLNGKDVTSEFATRANGRYEGVLTGLQNGTNTLAATLPDGSGAQITITNHSIGGPVFSGPQVEPWVCQSTATDAQCDQPISYSYKYMPATGGGFQSYDPANPPPSALIATATTDQGVTVPYIIREETGYEDRDQYAIATLFQPGQTWQPWAPQNQWNGKLVIEHGASCGADRQTGTAPSVEDDAALSRGFAVMSTALDNAGHDCNVVTEAESLIMAKEHLTEAYGPIRYTIGTGCSGGSLAQQQIANAYPGVYQGILPQCSFPDAWSTGQQLADYFVLRHYLENPTDWSPGVVWTPLSIAAVEGHPNHLNSIELSTLYFTSLGDPSYACAGVSASERYNAQTNPGGVRCDLADYMVNVFGRRKSDGFAGRPLDNVGVQYGLDALKAGTITPAQFVDLNVKAGGADIDGQWQPQRTVADQPALRNAYRSGAINETNNMKDVAIIDLRGPDPGAFHDVYRAFAVRARLQRENGTYANQVIWEGLAPIIGDATYTTQGLVAMDHWLAAVEADHSSKPLSQKLIDDKPADIHDQCSDGVGQVLPGTEACQAIVQAYQTPRMVAGESIATDNNKCRLKPLVRSDYYPVQFTDAQWASLEKVFPTGVCDWSKPGVSQAPTLPWLTYDGAVGGKPLGSAPRSTPLG